MTNSYTIPNEEDQHYILDNEEIIINGKQIRAFKKIVKEEFAVALKKELFSDPEPCCMGVRPRDADKIIDRLCEQESLVNLEGKGVGE